MTEENWVTPPSDVEFINAKKLFEAGTLGVILEGTYVGPVKNQFGTEDFKFLNGEGKTVIINQTGSLTHQLKNIAPDTLCQISYEGKELVENGKNAGRDVHNFKVLISG